jgi:threonine/homoserine/homoserine lactone efflux protein
VDVDAGSVAVQIATLGLVFILLATLSDGLYALAAGSAAGWLRGRSGFVRGERYATGGVLVGLGLLTAFSGAKSNQ